MDIGELHERGHELLRLVRSRVDEANWRSAYSLLYHGEEEEFADLLLAMLVNQKVVLRVDEIGLLRQLTGSFPVAEYDRSLYQYLADPEIMDRVVVAERDDHGS